jgi:GT2 family glycosyltransferase
MSVRVLDATVQEASLQADAEVLVLVGDGAAPLPDCVPMLLRSLARLPDAAVVGGRVVGRDGGLLEAGGHLAGDGTVRLIGTGYSDPDDPAYGYVREVDWCSRNMLATWRSVWDELGGFDMNYRSSHFQDADYCLRVGHNGGRIYYQPASVVVRVGGDSRPSAEPADRHLFADRFTGGAVRVA